MGSGTPRYPQAIKLRRRRRGPLWPVLLMLLGALTLLPVRWLQEADLTAHEFLLSGRLLDPRSLWQDPPEAQALEGSWSANPDLLARIEAGRRPLQPPPGWSRDGTFHLVPVGGDRGAERILLGTRDAVPHQAPALLVTPGPGRDRTVHLLGFATGGAGVRPAVTPITSSESRIAAWTGSSVGQEGLLFVAEGDGSPRLKVKGPETLQGLRDGDPVWVDASFLRQGAHAWSPPAGDFLFLGTIRQDPRFRDPEEEFQVELPWTLASLQDVAVFFPAGFPLPVAPTFAPRALAGMLPGTQEAGRQIWTTLVGREAGLDRGLAVVSEGVFLGRIWRAGWGVSQVRALGDAGFRQRVLVLQEDRCLPWILQVEGRLESGALAVGQVPSGTMDGALVVTSGADPAVPAGLLLGELNLVAEAWVLRPAEGGGPLQVLRHGGDS